MSAIPCSSVNLKTMADGTLRISFDVEPMHAQDAFRLFAAPGTPAAIAALQVGYEQKVDTSPEPVQKTPKSVHVGPLAWEAIQLCQNETFHKWLGIAALGATYVVAGAAMELKRICGVKSRNEFDTDADKGQLFIDRIRVPFMKHLRGIELERETS